MEEKDMCPKTSYVSDCGERLQSCMLQSDEDSKS